MIILYHGIAFLCGFILDLILGDPEGWPHPVRWIGKLIAVLDVKMMGPMEKDAVFKKSDGKEGSETPADDQNRKSKHGKKTNADSGATEENRRAYRKGIVLVFIVTLSSALGAAVILLAGYRIHPVCGIILETILTWWILAVKSLRAESMAVYRKLARGNIKGARKQVARIVGRDTDVLDEAGIARACVETIAESTCDGILAPMLYTAVGGPVLGYAAKAVNTMDSMVGYKNERYLYFGRAAALFDDVINYLPARMSAWFIIAAASFLEKTGIGRVESTGRKQEKQTGRDKSTGRNPRSTKSTGRNSSGKKEERRYSAKDAVRIYRRDHTHSASPNAGHPESAIAGALGIQLGGGAVYAGRFLPKAFMGEPLYKIRSEDIRRANTLMLTAASLAEAAFVIVILIGFAVVRSGLLNL